jgi:hypothetical protein
MSLTSRSGRRRRGGGRMRGTHPGSTARQVTQGRHWLREPRPANSEAGVALLAVGATPRPPGLLLFAGTHCVRRAHADRGIDDAADRGAKIMVGAELCAKTRAARARLRPRFCLLTGSPGPRRLRAHPVADPPSGIVTCARKTAVLLMRHQLPRRSRQMAVTQPDQSPLHFRDSRAVELKNRDRTGSPSSWCEPAF